jgi:lipopolysaccharide biosynthesis regulator YciM
MLKAVREMASAPRGAWLAHVLEAFLPVPSPAGGPTDADREPTVDRAASAQQRQALVDLAALESDPDLARGLGLMAAMRACAAGDLRTARAQLREAAEREPSDLVVAAFLADLDRAAGDGDAAARVASNAAAAAAAGDAELAAALRLEAALGRWREGDRKGALDELETALAAAPQAAKLVLAWASRGVDVDAVDGRRRAIERAAQAGDDERVLALERFATELGGGDPDDAAAALATLERAPEGDLGIAAALARLLWSAGASNADALRDAVARIASRGPRAAAMAAAEQVRIAREAGDVQELARAASRWWEAGGGLPSALEWLAAAHIAGDAAELGRARQAIAESLQGSAREQMLAAAALAELQARPGEPAPLVAGESAAVRLANLELSPPGCDPRRRFLALSELDGALGDDAEIDAVAMAGWSALAASDLAGARAAFERAAAARPVDLACWEGLRAVGEQSGDKALRARAAAELGARCQNAARGAAFWEEAALVWLELGDDANAERALEASFARDGRRAVAFDKLFRRVRDRKDNDKLLALIARRLEHADAPQEILKLYWEQARALRDKGDQDAALGALEHVTMLDPDHVGALALLGEINIRRGRYEAAAQSLARLAMLDAAPAKNRITAGVAAVDLYENKLQRFDKALEVLLSLHAAKISTLPVRERLARAAARTGSWKEAAAILEELMHERAEAEGRIEAARLAMAIYRDRLGNAQGGAAAIVKLLEESPTDGEGIDMLLQTEHPPATRTRLLEKARAALVEALQARPTDVTAVRRLVKVARALADSALQQAALSVQLSLGAGDAQTEQAFAQLASRKTRTPQIAIGEAMLRSLLAPGDDGPIAELFVALGPTLAEALGPNLEACGVGRRDRVDPRSGVALRNEIAAWAGAFGVREFDLYVGGKDPLCVQGVAGEVPSLVVGAGVNAPLAPLTRARVARELLAITRGTTVVRTRDDVTVAAVVVAACRLADVPIEHPPYAVLAEVERLLGKAISRKTRKLLPELCAAVVRSGADARAWSKRALASHDRVACVASGDVGVVLSDALGVSIDKVAAAVRGKARAEELLRFVLSPPYVELRRSLGLEGA